MYIYCHYIYIYIYICLLIYKQHFHSISSELANKQQNCKPIYRCMFINELSNNLSNTLFGVYICISYNFIFYSHDYTYIYSFNYNAIYIYIYLFTSKCRTAVKFDQMHFSYSNTCSSPCLSLSSCRNFEWCSSKNSRLQLGAETNQTKKYC